MLASGAQPHPQSIYQAILAQQFTQVRLCSALLVTVEKCNESFDSVCRIRDHLDCFGVLITSYIDRLASPKSGASRCWQCFFWPRRFMDNRCFGDGWIAQKPSG